MYNIVVSDIYHLPFTIIKIKKLLLLHDQENPLFLSHILGLSDPYAPFQHSQTLIPTKGIS